MGVKTLPSFYRYILILLTFFKYQLVYANQISPAISYDWTTISQLTGAAMASAGGQDLKVVTIKLSGSSARVHRFYAQASLHGNESFTTEFVLWLAKQIRGGTSELNRLPAGSIIDLLIVANPDSFRKSRFNKNGVNLNRNFGVLWGQSSEPTGNRAFSEPETQAIRSMFNHYDYTAAVDIHGYLNWIVTPSSPTAISKSISEQEKRSYELWTNGLLANSTKLSNYKIKDAYSLGDGGAFEDWAFWSKGVYSFCLEIREDKRYLRDQNGRRIDTFKGYDLYIGKVFREAVKLKDMSALHTSSNLPIKGDRSKRVASEK